MKRLTSYLSENPIVVLIMFLVSLIGGIMGIVLGWSQFYNDYLSKKLELPIWLLLLLLIIILSLYIFLSKRPNKVNITKELETIEGRIFGVQQVELDGKRFVNCEFDGTELIYKGENGFALEHNSFKQGPRFKFVSYAGTTVNILKALHSDPSFEKYVDAIFE